MTSHVVHRKITYWNIAFILTPSNEMIRNFVCAWVQTTNVTTPYYFMADVTNYELPGLIVSKAILSSSILVSMSLEFEILEQFFSGLVIHVKPP